MARFDVHEVRGGLALDCQSDRLSQLPTRFVVPLEPANPVLIIDHWLNPTFTIREQPMVLVTQLAGTIPARELGGWVASLAADREQLTIQRALDTLLTDV